MNGPPITAYIPQWVYVATSFLILLVVLFLAFIFISDSCERKLFGLEFGRPCSVSILEDAQIPDVVEFDKSIQIDDAQAILNVSAFAQGRRRGSPDYATVEVVIVLDQETCSIDNSVVSGAQNLSLRAAATCIKVLQPRKEPYQLKVVRRFSGITENQEMAGTVLVFGTAAGT